MEEAMSTQDILNKLDHTYGQKKEIAEAPPAMPRPDRSTLTGWKDSMPICRLSELLRIHKDAGITLTQTMAGDLVLRFEPGIKKGEQDRLRIAQIAIGYLIEALPDLRECLQRRLIMIPYI
jgi:hypothetical protein